MPGVGVAAAASEGDFLFRDPARESEAPPEMAIGLALAALAFDAEEAEKLEVEVALAGLAGFDEQLVDAPTFEGGGGTTCGGAAAEEEEEEPAEPMRSRAKASRARRDGWRCTPAAAAAVVVVVVWLAVVVVIAGPVGSYEQAWGGSVSVSRGCEREWDC